MSDEPKNNYFPAFREKLKGKELVNFDAYLKSLDDERESHALLPPSSAERWLVCPGSVGLCKGIKKKPPSAEMKEGSVAHKIAEICLRTGMNTENADIQSYIDYCNGQPGKTFIEEKVPLSSWIPGGFGTSDLVGINNNNLTVIDLKFGKGVKVDARDNPQLKLYALGSWFVYGLCYDIQHVCWTVYQPRRQNICLDGCNIVELLEWGRYVKKRAILALSPNAPLVPGEKQCLWCDAKPLCPAIAEQQLAIAKKEFNGVTLPAAELLTPFQISELLPKLDFFQKWAKSIEKYALEEALRGTKIPGHKIVPGRSKRQWLPVAGKYLSEYLKESEIYTKKINPMGSMEKILGKQHEVFSRATHKPPGKPVLVQENNGRKPFPTEGEEFKGISL